jgi:hypothetical protein
MTISIEELDKEMAKSAPVSIGELDEEMAKYVSIEELDKEIQKSQYLEPPEDLPDMATVTAWAKREVEKRPYKYEDYQRKQRIAQEEKQERALSPYKRFTEGMTQKQYEKKREMYGTKGPGLLDQLYSAPMSLLTTGKEDVARKALSLIDPAQAQRQAEKESHLAIEHERALRKEAGAREYQERQEVPIQQQQLMQSVRRYPEEYAEAALGKYLTDPLDRFGAVRMYDILGGGGMAQAAGALEQIMPSAKEAGRMSQMTGGMLDLAELGAGAAGLKNITKSAREGAIKPKLSMVGDISSRTSKSVTDEVLDMLNRRKVRNKYQELVRPQAPMPTAPGEIPLLQSPPKLPTGMTPTSIANELLAGKVAGKRTPIDPSVIQKTPSGLPTTADVGRRISTGLKEPVPDIPTALQGAEKVPEILPPTAGKPAPPVTQAGAPVIGGKRPLARPDLAQIGRTEEAAATLNLADEMRTRQGLPKKQSFKVWDEDAAKKLVDPTYKADLGEKVKSGAVLDDATDVRAGQELYNQVADDAFKNIDTPDFDAKFNEAVKMADGWRRGGEEQARALVARRGVKKPGESMGEFARSMLTTKPGNIDNLVKKGRNKKATSVFNKWKKQTKELVKQWEKDGITLDNIDEMTKNDRSTYLRVYNDIRRLSSDNSIGDAIFEYRRNALMFNLKTSARNLIGGLNAVHDTLLSKPLSRAITGKFGNNYYTLKPMASKKVWGRAIENMLDTIRYELPAYDVWNARANPALDIEMYKPPAIKGVKGRAIRMPQTTNAAIDQFVKTMHAHSEVASHAYDIGKSKGYKFGTKKMDDFITSQIDDLSSESWVKAIQSDETNRVTFQGKSGPTEELLISASKKGGAFGAAVELMFPFKKTPVQIGKEAVRKSPIGAARIPSKYLGQFTKKGKSYTFDEFARDVAETALGTAELYLVYDYVDNPDGKIEITGFPDYSKRARQERKFKQQDMPPMHIRVGDKMYSYKNIEPFSLRLGTAVELSKMIKNGENLNTPKGLRAMNRLLQGYTDQTYIKTVGDIVKMFEDIEYYGERFPAEFASSWIPRGIPAAGRAMDETVRERRDMGEEGERRGFGEKVMEQSFPFPTAGYMPPPKVNMWGEDVEKYDSGGTISNFLMRLVSPVQVREQRHDVPGKIMAGMIEYNKNAIDPWWGTWPGKSISVGKTIEGNPIMVEMNNEEYYKASKLAGVLSKSVVNHMEWPEKFDAVNIISLKKVFSDSNKSSRDLIKNAIILRRNGEMDKYKEQMDYIDDMIKAYDIYDYERNGNGKQSN